MLYQKPSFPPSGYTFTFSDQNWHDETPKTLQLMCWDGKGRNLRLKHVTKTTLPLDSGETVRSALIARLESWLGYRLSLLEQTPQKAVREALLIDALQSVARWTQDMLREAPLTRLSIEFATDTDEQAVDDPDADNPAHWLYRLDVQVSRDEAQQEEDESYSWCSELTQDTPQQVTDALASALLGELLEADYKGHGLRRVVERASAWTPGVDFSVPRVQPGGDVRMVATVSTELFLPQGTRVDDTYRGRFHLPDGTVLCAAEPLFELISEPGGPEVYRTLSSRELNEYGVEIGDFLERDVQE